MTNATPIPAALRRRRAELQAAPPVPPAEDPPQAPASTPSEVTEESFVAKPENTTDGQLTRIVETVSTTSPPTDPESDKSWEHKYKSIAGRLRERDNEIDLLKQSVRALSEQVTSMRAQPAPPPPPSAAPTSASSSAVDALTDAERATYAKAIPVIRKVAQQVFAELVTPVLGELHEAKQVATRAREEIVETRVLSYQDRLNSAIPDLEELMDEEAFTAFIRRPVPYMQGLTVKDVLAQAHEAQDVSTIQAVIKEYRASKSQAPAAAASPDAFRQPNGSARSSQAPAAPAAAAPPKLAWSKRVEAGTQFRRGKIPAQEFAKITAMFDQAIKEGRVDYNA